MNTIPALDNLKYVLEAAVAVDGAIGGAIQLVGDDQKSLHMFEAMGLPPWYFEKFSVVRSGVASSCDQAFSERRRVVIRDVEHDPSFAPFREYALKAGYRAVQSTPLIDRDRYLRGVLSTYYAAPHHPSTAELEALDRCCAAATLLLECDAFGKAANDRDRQLGLPQNALSPAAIDAAGAARRLLATLARGDHRLALDAVIRNLDLMAAELWNRVRRGDAGQRVGVADQVQTAFE